MERVKTLHIFPSPNGREMMLQCRTTRLAKMTGSPSSLDEARRGAGPLRRLNPSRLTTRERCLPLWSSGRPKLRYQCSREGLSREGQAAVRVLIHQQILIKLWRTLEYSRVSKCSKLGPHHQAALEIFDFSKVIFFL